MTYKDKRGTSPIPSITISIPAYNEEDSIGHTLQAILAQNDATYVLDGIVVYADGCSDGTIERVEEIRKLFPVVRIVESEVRHGKIYQLNRMFEKNDSDFLIVLDADIGFRERGAIDRLVRAAVSKPESVMFAAHQIPLCPEDIIGKILHATFLLWDYIRLGNPDRRHVQNFYGAATLYRQRFTDVVQIPPEIMSMRTYLYQMGKRLGGFEYVYDASILYWPPGTITDFVRMRSRAFGSDEEMLQKIFGDEYERVQSIPLRYKVLGVLKFFRDHPVYAIPALLLNFFLKIEVERSRKRGRSVSQIWQTAPSTKRLIRRTRIVFSNYDDTKNPSYAGGGAFAVHEVARRLGNLFEITVLTGNYPGAADEMKDGVQYRRIGIPFAGGRIGQILYHFVLPWHAFFMEYDVWIESFTPPFSTSFIPFFTKRPVIGLVHLLSGEEMQRKYGLPFHWIEQFGLKFYRNCIAVSEVSHQKLLALNHKINVVVIPNGIDQAVYFPQGGERTQILYIGRIEMDQKGLDLLLRAYQIVQNETDAPLIIAGSGQANEMKHLKQLIRELKLERRVQIIGRIVGDEAKRALFNKSLVVALPSRCETFSLVALEALSTGTPLVTFDIEGLRWIPTSASLKAEPFETTAYARLLSNVVRDQGIRKALADAGRNFSKKYDWDNVAHQYAEAINHVLVL